MSDNNPPTEATGANQQDADASQPAVEASQQAAGAGQQAVEPSQPAADPSQRAADASQRAADNSQQDEERRELIFKGDLNQVYLLLSFISGRPERNLYGLTMQD